MRYLLPYNSGYEHLEKKFERTVLTNVGGYGLEKASCVRSFLFVSAYSKREWPLRARKYVLSRGL